MTQLLRVGVIAVMAAAVMGIVGAATAASALSYDNIQGKWCGTESDYTFTRDTLTVSNLPNNVRDVSFKISGYDFSDSTVVVHYLVPTGRGDAAATAPFRTTFGEFSADGQLMAQAPSEAGPRRPFHRC